MNLETLDVQCPYCGEQIEIDVETLESRQSFIEDCSVCCRPIQYTAEPGVHGLELTVQRSD